MTKDVRVALTPRQAKYVRALLLNFSFASDVDMARDIIAEIDKSLEYRENNPSGYRLRRQEQRKHKDD